MKKLLLFKKIIIVILFVGLSSAGWSQVLYEDFNYPTPATIGGNGAAGTSSNNWTTHSVSTGQTTTVDIQDGSLTYTGLKTSTGNKVSFFSNANATSRDINRSFTSTATTLYFSALINIVDNSQITTNGDYFLHFGATAGTSVTSLGGRLGVKSVNTGLNFRFAVQNTSTGTPTFTDNGSDLTFGTTYLVVIKYDRTAVPTVATMWVNPVTLGSTEPEGSVSNSSGTGTFAAFSSICLRENGTTPKALIDEIRVGETFADVTPKSVAVTPTITLTAPVAGNEWMQGTTHDITWTATGTNPTLLIEYTGNASDVTPTWVPLNDAVIVDASAGTFSVTVPGDLPPNSDSRIRITDIPETAVGLSDLFTITAAPVPTPVATFSPLDAAINVGVKSDITITFDVPVRNIDDSEITDANVSALLTVATTDALGTAVPYTATIDADKKVITISPDADLAFNQLYFVAIDAVEGLSNNATSPQYITFTTAPEAAIITVTEPAAGSEWMQGTTHNITWSASNTNTNVKIEYSGNASDATPTWVTVNDMDVIAASTGLYVADIPADLAPSTDCRIRISDIPETTFGLSEIFSITAAPAPVATFNPLDAATSVDVAGNITITFDVPVRNIDDSEITDANVASLLTLTTTDASGVAVPFTATIDASKKVITIDPDGNLANSQLYYVSIAAVEGASNNATVGQSVTFTTADLVVSISNVTITEVSPYHAGDLVNINWTSSNVTNVKLEAWLPDQNIWTEMFASTPSDGTESFTIPADAAYGTGYKVRVSDVDDATVYAESGAFTIIAVVDNLLDLRAQPVNAIVKYTGIATVTFTQTTRNQKYIQDATAAVLIDDPNPGFVGAYNVGDGITNIEGKILLYHTLIEFTPQAATGEHATGAVIVPEVRTLESLTTDDQCKLVKIEDFAFQTPTQFDVNGLFVKSKNYDIEGQSNTALAYRTAFTGADYIGGKVPVGPFSSICIVGQFDAQMQITARSWSDMTVPTVADFSADQTFVLTGENVTFSDLSSNNPISWEWTFEGGTPATSTEQNPVVTYADKGTYSVTLKATNASGGTNTVTKTGYISTGVVGISSLQSNVTVYPNPSHGNLYITNPAKNATEVTIYNGVGKQVSSTISDKDVISLNIASFSKGIFMVKITNTVTKSVQVKKVVLN